MCDMLVPWKSLNGTHRRMSQCTWRLERKILQLVVEEEREVTASSFRDYGRPLEMVTSFKYLGQVILVTEAYWPALLGNLTRANKACSRMSRILSREGAASQLSRLFLKAVIQAVLLFGAETWVVTPSMSKSLGGFQHQVLRWLMVQLPQRQ